MHPARVLLWMIPFLLGLAGIAGAHGDPSAFLEDGAERRVYRLVVDTKGLDRLSNTVDVWGYYPLEKKAILFLSTEERQRLEKQGLRPELDSERNAWLETVEKRRAEALELRGTEKGGGGIPGFPCYRTVEETHADLAAAAAANPDIATWNDIGDTWLKEAGQGGYDHYALVLTNNNLPGPKPVFLVIAAMHAREYSTAELATRYALHLIDQYGIDPDITWLLDHREIHVVAQQNPDGRKRAETGISWRKNANNDFCSNSDFRGIDLNRNSTVFWGGAASSGSQCSDIYRGPAAASEPETKTIEDYMAQVFLDQKGDMDDPAPLDAEGVFISIHSFSELVLYPWEGTNADGPNHAELRTLGRRFGYFNQYSVCQDCLGTASGTTVDAAYGEYGVAAYTFELGNNFFEGCTAFESTIYPDNLLALIYAAKVADRPYQKASGPDALELRLSTGEVQAGEPVTLEAVIDDTRFHSGGFGTEPVQAIQSARMAMDLATLETGGGTALSAIDGSFDSTSESVGGSLDTTGLSAGRHLIYVVGTDASGQVGPPTAIFLEVTEQSTIFDDGFEGGSTTAWSQAVP